MSQYPTDFTSSLVPDAPRVPNSVKVLSIIGIILAAFALVCMPMSLIPYVMKIPPPHGDVVNSIKNDGALFGTVLFGTGLMVVLGLVLLIGSIGSLMLKSFGWMTMVVYAMISIITGIAWTVVNFAFIQPRMSVISQQAGIPPTDGQIQTIIGIVIGFASLVYQFCIIYFYSRAHVKQAFGKR